MKYGDTLRQRSIPEWGHFNIDYDYLKDLIKHYTTPGAGKAQSIPGQGESTERAFEETFFQVLSAQHDRINLFIKSKSGEIERRLDYISKRLSQLQARRPSVGQGTRLPARTVEKYAKIDADVTKAGEEIRSLSRFRIAQRTGFYKILKKYRRWTRDRELELRFKEEVTSSPDSFFQLDLGYLLDQYIEVLGAIRAPWNGPGPSISHDHSNHVPSISRLTRAVEQGSNVDYDNALSTVPLGSRGSRATYWIHPDHLVEVEVLLLEYMRLFTHQNSRSTPSSTESPYATPLRRHSSSTVDKFSGADDDVGLVLLDQLDIFAKRQNTSTIGSTEEGTGSTLTRSAGNARWTSSGEAEVIVGLRSNDGVQGRENPSSVKIKRKNLESFLDISTSYSERPRTPFSEDGAQGQNNKETGDVVVRQWLEKHEGTRPIAGICSKRNRFVGLHNNATGGMWASLDKDIFFRDDLHQHLQSYESLVEARSGSIDFPHAVLEIRREGHQSSALIQLLNQSHLVERIRGFSLETHAVWVCRKPDNMSPPTWLSLLEEDIRKLPAPVQRRRRHASNADSASNSQTSPPQTSASATSATSPYTSKNGETSATSASELLEPPPLQAFRKKQRKPFAEYPPPMQAEEPHKQQRYWNEYDNPESEEDEGYYIYVDPDAPITFPGYEALMALVDKTKKIFSRKKSAEESSLLGSPDYDGVSEDETVDGASEEPLANYGTIPTQEREQAHDGYFSGIFRSLRDPHRDMRTLDTMRRRTELERQTLLSEIHIRQSERERAKFLTYFMSLLAGAVIDMILALLAATSRRKLRGEVDTAVMLGVIFNLLLLLVAVTSMKTRHDRLGWIHQGFVYSVVIAMVVVDVLLFLWALNLQL